MHAEPFFHWSQSARELVGFLASFLASGAIGFRYAALRGLLGHATGGADAPPEHAALDARVYADAARRAALIGLVGALVSAVLLAIALPALAARRHTTPGALITGDVFTAARVVLLALVVVGFALAAARRQAGWALAALGIVVGAVLGAFVGRWGAIIAPVHALVGGLWIGTLFVLVAAGLSALLRDEPARARRGAIAAAMVNNFSPVALTCGGLVVLSGLTAAWRNLGSIPALWSSDYGRTLLVKLCFVAVVFGLGAWNWQRQRPTLGSEDAARAIRRSSTFELLAATIVLLVTAVLITLPTPVGG